MPINMKEMLKKNIEQMFINWVTTDDDREVYFDEVVMPFLELNQDEIKALFTKQEFAELANYDLTRQIELEDFDSAFSFLY